MKLFDARSIQALLDPLKRGFRADGYALTADVVANQLIVRVGALSDACDDCLVPKEIMRAMVLGVLQGQWPQFVDDDIQIIYPTDTPA
jgi:hypothetical protein